MKKPTARILAVILMSVAVFASIAWWMFIVWLTWNLLPLPIAFVAVSLLLIGAGIVMVLLASAMCS